ncbi:MAG: transporter substrate-binding domain-containing protein [Marinobacterium sp.]|nr:transporter substrate-binding domain-containing protein [Marinobacterium sp.]
MKYMVQMVVICWCSIALNAHALTSVRLQLSGEHQFQFAGYYAAIEQGFYAHEGLKVEIVPAQTGVSAISEVVNGRADFGVADISLLMARLTGEPVVMLASIFRSSPVVLALRPDIELSDGLVDNPLMIDRAWLEQNPLRFVLEDAGVELDQLQLVARSEVTRDAVTDTLVLRENDPVEAYKHGRIDGFVGSIGTELFELQRQQIPYRVISAVSAGISSWDGSLFTGERLLIKRPELAAGFVRATLKGWRYALAHQAELVELITRDYAPDKSREAVLFEAQELSKLVLPSMFELGVVDRRRVEAQVELYLSRGLVSDVRQLPGFVRYPVADVALSPDAQRYLAEHPVLQVYIRSRAPLSFQERGQMQGFSVDYLRLLGRQLGVKFEFTQDPTLPADVIIEDIPGRAAGDIYLSLPVAVASHQQVHDMNDLAGMKVGVVQGLNYSNRLAARAAGIQLLTCRDSMLCMTRLATKELDAVVDVQPVLQYGLSKYAMPGVQLSKPLHDPQLRTMAHRLVSHHPLLQQALAKAAESVERSSLEVLQHRWLSPEGRAYSARLSLSDWGQGWLNSIGTLRYCADPGSLPWGGLNHELRYTGVSADYIQLFERYLGLDFQLVHTRSRAHSRKALLEGRCDLIPMEITDEDKALRLEVSRPYFSTGLWLVSRKGEPLSRGSSGRYAFLEGAPWTVILRQRYPGIGLVPVSDLSAALDQVASGELDGVMGSPLTLGFPPQGLQQWQALLEQQTGMVISSLPGEPVGFGLLMARGRPELQVIIDRMIMALTEREHINIQNRWRSSTRQLLLPAVASAQVAMPSGMGVGWLFSGALLLLITPGYMLWQRWSDGRLYLSGVERYPGVTDRTGLSSALRQAVGLAETARSELAVIMVDVESVRSISHKHRRAETDRIQSDVARSIMQLVPSPGLVGCWDNQRFMLLLPGEQAIQAKGLAEQLHSQMAVLDSPSSVSLRCCVAQLSWSPGQSAQQLEYAATQALEGARQSGLGLVTEISRLDAGAIL